MPHLPSLVVDLALLLGAAALVTVLFKALKQPVVLGYIVAGFLVGPGMKWLPTVRDIEGIRIWAEIGVIFLLFSLGLEFSFRKLLRVGGSALVTAIVQLGLMIGLGYGAGRALGWNSTDALFYGAMLSISSTTIILRTLEELGLKERKFARLVFGVLVIEDLAAVLILVLLSTIAATRQFEGMALASAAVKLTFFILSWFGLGIFLIPSLLRRLRPMLNEETLLILATGLCLGMVVLAAHAGYSPALGAFMMGSILAETSSAHRIEKVVKPVENLFAAVFFVSVGMLVEPAALREYIGLIALTSALVIGGKILGVMFGAVLAGRPLKMATQAGFSLAQIGEFSFIIATLGLRLKVTSDFLYPVAVATSALTTLTTPYLIRASGRAHGVIESLLPPRLRAALVRYDASAEKVRAFPEWFTLVRAAGKKVLFNGIAIVALHLLAVRFARPFLEQRGVTGLWGQGIALAFTLLAATPFFWGMALDGAALPASSSRDTRGLRDPARALLLMRILLGLALGATIIYRQLPRVAPLHFLALAGVLVIYAFFRRISTAYRRIEQRFLDNLADRESSDRRAGLPTLAPWSAHLAPVPVTAESTGLGQALAELHIRERFGITIALIERGSRRITAPGRQDVLFPGDLLWAIGTDEQLESFAAFLRPQTAVSTEGPGHDYELTQMRLTTGSPFVGRSIRDSGLREAVTGLVVGIERDGKRILNPDSALVFASGDILWIVGDPQRIRAAAHGTEKTI
jgi:CPA2 family monovalent cation:H+ antiporter-2